MMQSFRGRERSRHMYDDRPLGDLLCGGVVPAAPKRRCRCVDAQPFLADRSPLECALAARVVVEVLKHVPGGHRVGRCRVEVLDRLVETITRDLADAEALKLIGLPPGTQAQ